MALVLSFGLITDVHYADAAASGSRVYRDGLLKVRAATEAFTAAGVDFLVELGDFKDTDAGRCGGRAPDAGCTNLTLGFLDRIEAAVAAGYGGPRYHVLGNHDVDILNQSAVLAREADGPAAGGGGGYYSMVWPPPGPDTSGCLARSADGRNVWVVHKVRGAAAARLRRR